MCHAAIVLIIYLSLAASSLLYPAISSSKSVLFSSKVAISKSGKFRNGKLFEMATLEEKITDLEEEIAGYKRELAAANTPEEKQSLRALIASSRDTVESRYSQPNFSRRRF